MPETVFGKSIFSDFGNGGKCEHRESTDGARLSIKVRAKILGAGVTGTSIDISFEMEPEFIPIKPVLQYVLFLGCGRNVRDEDLAEKLFRYVAVLSGFGATVVAGAASIAMQQHYNRRIGQSVFAKLRSLQTGHRLFALDECRVSRRVGD